MTNPLAVEPSVLWPSGQPQQLRKQLLSWHKTHGRHDLPWIARPDVSGQVNDYHVAVSEIMMQQTTVAVGKKRFPQWLERFPDWNSLASASSVEVMKAWEGLGYYARAHSLHQMAQYVVSHHQGRIPLDRKERLALPGVGPTTASALGAFIYGAREPIWDANVNRVWRRWWADRAPAHASPREQQKWNWEMAQQAMPRTKPTIRAWTQAVMDLGALACTPKAPQCTRCPLSHSCRANALGQQEKWSAPSVKAVVQSIGKRWGFVVNPQGQVAMVLPKDRGLWPGLWRFPELQPSAQDRHGSTSGQNTYASGHHKLTHRHISWSVQKWNMKHAEMSPRHWPQSFVDSWEDLQWIHVADLNALALPKPLRQWWDSLDTPTQKRWCQPTG